MINKDEDLDEIKKQRMGEAKTIKILKKDSRYRRFINVSPGQEMLDEGVMISIKRKRSKMEFYGLC